MKEPGRLIALEGVDGSGKTTHARLLAATIGALCTAEPGGTALGVLLRGVLLDTEAAALVPRAEALLMAADRAQHVEEVIRPALTSGRWVVTERYSGSTLAYQGYGRALDLEDLGHVVTWATQGLEPDLTVLVDVPLAVARQRRGRGGDRLERLDDAFHERVRAGYLILAAAHASWVVVDGTGEREAVGQRLLSAVAERLGPLPAGRS